MKIEVNNLSTNSTLNDAGIGNTVRESHLRGKSVVELGGHLYDIVNVSTTDSSQTFTIRAKGKNDR